MRTFFSISLFLLLFSCVYLPLTSATATHNRRALHEPFLPQDSNQAPAPQPPTPKYPFSTSTPDKQPSPFFPSAPFPPSPPSPPAPSTFASYPANISSLVLPQSPKSKSGSSKFVAVALVASAGILISISIFIYIRRRRRRSFGETKADGSENNNGVFHASGLPRSRRSPQNSSEFLYLGTMVNSQGGVDPNVAPSCDSGGGDVDLRKLHSPELRPLPPLAQQSLRLNYENAGAVGSSDEEFYSPRESSAGHESSIGTESASRTAFTALATDNFDASRSESSSSLYTSSSNAGSPTRSVSISISPPASLSPRPKSPEMVANQTAPPLPLLSLPPRPVMTQLANLNSSPSLSPPSSSSPERASEKSLDSSPRIRISNVSVQNGDSPARITYSVPNQYANEKNSRSPSLSSSSSPERTPEKSLGSSPRIRISNVSIQNGESPARITYFVPNQYANEKNSRSPSLSSSSSPERASEKSLRSSPRIRISNVSIQNGESPARITHFVPNQYANKEDSPSPSVSPSSSPERPSAKSLDSSPRITISNVSIQNGESPARITPTNRNNSRSPSISSLSSPERPLEKTQNSSPVISTASNQNAESLARTSSATMNELANKPNSRSPSLSSLPSPEKTQDSPARISNVSNPDGASPPTTVQKPMAVSVTLPSPPPPPPPPPAGHWESPVSIPSIRQPILKPPVLATPSRPPPPIPSPILVSPVELPPNSETAEKNEETPKPKLKPLHWDKVRASSDREMVWDQLKSSSFILNEEMIETLFVVNTQNSKEPTRSSVLPSPIQENRVLDPKKAQNIAISLRALNVTIEEVCDALSEGNAEALGSELLESLLKMAPTKEEERRLKEYKDDSPIKLGTAERFLKAVLDIPFAFRRVDAMLYIANFESEVEYLKRSFGTLEAACEELRNSRMFLKLLEAVLKTGNRMNVGTNRGDAQAFKLDTLLKLVDVKGTDGRTTLLHFVVQEIIRSEGARLSEGNNNNNQNPKSTLSDDAKCRKLGLQVVSGLSSELMNVKKAAVMDSDVLSSDVMKLSRGIGNVAEIVRLNEGLGSEESIRKFSESMKRFVKMGEEEIIKVQAHESVALSLVKEITEYFHGNSAKEEAHPFRIFMVVRDFLTVLDRVCKEVGMINERTTVSSAHKFPVPVNPMLQPVVGGSGRRQFSSFDGEIASP